MPKRSELQNIILLGAGPIVIGQACEFDYSGTQACKALREDGYRVVLINSNPATIMTDPEVADATYVEPVTPSSVRAVIEKELAEHPGENFAMLPSMGGQVSLNVALSLSDSGYLEKKGIQLLGAKPDVIRKAENRELFRNAMEKIGIPCARSISVTSLDEGLAALKEIGLPVILRPSFTLGGTGGGVAYNEKEFLTLLKAGLDISPVGLILVEESLLGWKEYEMEVVRDCTDNAIIICSIENIDPMGVHTGDSMTVAPALTLTDKEFQMMRDRAIACMREVGVETGGSNVQFAVNPVDGRQILVEMNPRVSRSSALASKATGFPIARVAAKLAVGYTLNEITNDITGCTPASFEPAIDYVVTKIPRFDFDKFPQAAPHLTTSMKSVGEVMAIGRNFSQSMQKALRSLETGLTGYDEVGHDMDKEALLEALETHSPMRILLIAEALRRGCLKEDIFKKCQMDPWFIHQISETVELENQLRQKQLDIKDPWDLLTLKKAGLSDARIATLSSHTEEEVAALRDLTHIKPVIKRIDTCAAEFRSQTAYMYSAYEGNGVNEPECEAEVSHRRKVVILGSGPNRIGQGIEFDYCCVHACRGLSEMGLETIMINCNPETVSTDYDISDRLYFEPLTREDVIEILYKEQKNGELLGVVVQFGGQTPLKLAKAIEEVGVKILGTSPDSIDISEDRERFKVLVDQLGLKQPPNRAVSSTQQALKAANEIGYPVILRPSYVLGGQSMEVVENDKELSQYMTTAVRVSNDKPVLVDSYLCNAIECDVDAITDGSQVRIAGVLEHIQPAGVHSGDSACVIPPYTLPPLVVEQMKRQTVALARALKVVGLMNVQFAVQGETVYLIEVNPRASRTIPFVAKACGVLYAKMAAKIMAGASMDVLKFPTQNIPYVAVKEVVLPFKRFEKSDPLLGPEMKSTGEVMGFGQNVTHAFARAQEASGFNLERQGVVLILSVSKELEHNRQQMQNLTERGIPVVAPEGLCHQLNTEGLTEVKRFSPVNDMVRLVLDPTPQMDSTSRSIRQLALRYDWPYFTSKRASDLAVAVLTEGVGPENFRPQLQNQDRL